MLYDTFFSLTAYRMSIHFALSSFSLYLFLFSYLVPLVADRMKRMGKVLKHMPSRRTVRFNTDHKLSPFLDMMSTSKVHATSLQLLRQKQSVR